MPAEDADLDFDLVEPTPMLGGVMPFEFPGNAPRLCGRKRLVQARGRVGVEVIRNQANDGRLGVVNIDQCLQLVGKIPRGPSVGDRDMAIPGLGLEEHKEVTDAFALVFIVLPCGLTGGGGLRGVHVGQQLIRRLIEADAGALRIGRQGVEFEDVFHLTDEGGG